MRNIEIDEFYKLPSGTLCADWYGRIMIKNDTLYSKVSNQPYDFFYTDLNDSVDYDKPAGQSYNVDYESIERDGTFDEKRSFVVYERSDIIALITKLMNIKWDV